MEYPLGTSTHNKPQERRGYFTKMNKQQSEKEKNGDKE